MGCGTLEGGGTLTRGHPPVWDDPEDGATHSQKVAAVHEGGPGVEKGHVHA